MNIQLNGADTRDSKVDRILETHDHGLGVAKENISAIWDALISVAAAQNIDLARTVRDQYEGANPGQLA